ncbi:hypothetical protein DLE60_03265 [Micromonospora globispora]|nr:hypothetical protein DLE60_03265 [Micromonospora globispora]RQX07403.1 hypothetical protein DKL51_00955 [Micromonospora globispora]
MMVRDLVTSFEEFAAHESPGDLETRWHRQIVQPNSEIFTAVQSWIDPAEAETRLPELVDRRTELTTRSKRARVALQRAAILLTSVVATERPINAVVLVGLGGANGWAAPVDGEPTLFLAAELLPDPPFDVLLALHEMIHLVHLRRTAQDWPHERLDADLFREGLAVHATARLMPEVSPSGHLWFRPGEDAWIDRCHDMQATLRAQALQDLERTDIWHEWFSGTADRAGELPGRCGYWLGWKLLDDLVGEGPLDIAMHWSMAEASAHLRQALTR